MCSKNFRQWIFWLTRFCSLSQYVVSYIDYAVLFYVAGNRHCIALCVLSSIMYATWHVYWICWIFVDSSLVMCKCADRVWFVHVNCGLFIANIAINTRAIMYAKILTVTFSFILIAGQYLWHFCINPWSLAILLQTGLKLREMATFWLMSTLSSMPF